MSNPELGKKPDNYGAFGVVETKVAGIPLKICGVNWDENNYDLSAFEPYRQFIENLVADSICVVSQFSPDKRKYEAGIPTLRGVYIRPYNWGMSRGLRELFAKYEKEVFTVDPMCNAFWGMSWLGATLQFAALIFPEIKIINDAYKKTKISRRAILKFIPFAVMEAINAGTVHSSGFYANIENSHNTFLRRYAYGPNDFQNVKIAQGLELVPPMISKPTGDYILYVGGWAHSRAIEYYLEHRNVREAKNCAYQSNLGKWFACAVSQYTFANNNWQEVKHTPF